MVKQTIQIYCRVKPTKSKTSVNIKYSTFVRFFLYTEWL